MRDALRLAAVKAGEWLLILRLLAASAAVWGVLFVVSGLRAWWFGAGDLLVYSGAAIGTALVVGSAMVAHGLILRRWRARGRPPGERAAE